MKYKAFDTYLLDPGEPVVRTCWECNPAHTHLKNASALHRCISCGRSWLHGRFLNTFEDEVALDVFLAQHLPREEVIEEAVLEVLVQNIERKTR